MKKEYNVFEVLLNLSIFTFFGGIIIVLTKFFESYLQDLPLIFIISYIIGVVYFMILSLTTNWARKLKD